jgi:hypothetical protein
MRQFRTSDMYFAAFLKVNSVDFQGVMRDGSKVYFLFEYTDSVLRLKQAYYSGTGTASAKNFASEVKHFKSLIRSA